MDKYIKYIIEQLCIHYNYRITEIKDESGSEEFWGGINEAASPKKLFVFFKGENLSDINRIINSNLSLKEPHISVTKIIITKSNENISGLVNINNENILIINSITSDILYGSNATYNEAYEILNILNYSKNIRKDNKDSIITYIIIGINIAVYIVSVILSRSFFDINVNVLDFLGAKDNNLINQGEYYRLFTCMFLHSGILHIASNMYALYSIGGLAERIYGKKKYLIIYLLSGIIASMASYLFSDGISVGASGAIFGILGGVLVISHKLKNRIGTGLFKNIIFIIGINLFISFTIPNIDISAHAGGLIAGIVLSLVLFPKDREAV